MSDIDPRVEVAHTTDEGIPVGFCVRGFGPGTYSRDGGPLELLDHEAANAALRAHAEALVGDRRVYVAEDESDLNLFVRGNMFTDLTRYLTEEIGDILSDGTYWTEADDDEDEEE